MLLGVLLAFGLFTAPAEAAKFPKKPPNTAYFVDKADLISSADAATINEIASKLLDDERVPLFVVTIPSLDEYKASDMGVKRYTRKLFDRWGIGTKDRNYGMLLLVAVKDREARIELGADWKRRHDRAAENVMDNLIIPQFKRGNFSLGIIDGVRGMDAMARGLELPAPTTPWWYWPAIAIGTVFTVVLIANLFLNGRTGWAWALIAIIGVMLFYVLKATARGSGRGFGGGFSGGGGASGSW